MQEQEQNRTEQATPFKLNEARKRGQVAKSTDFNSCVVVCGLLVALVAWSGPQWQRLIELCTALFLNAATLQVDAVGFPSTAAMIAKAALALVLPFAIAGFAFSVIANLVQVGPIISAEPLKPKFERINPVAGFRRIFNKRMLFEALKSMLKLALFCAIAVLFFRSLWPSLPAASALGVDGLQDWLGDSAVALLSRLGVALLIVGLLDLAFVRWSYGRQMMMSRREVKEEIKRREGDPQIRARIRELQRENLKQSRSMKRVPEADVLITNPEHLAIALKYDRERMSAPVVLAKGADSWAAEMRAMASRRAIPVFENRRLARLLFRRAQIDQQIPAEVFVDVARIYAEIGNGGRNRAKYEAAQ